LAWRDSKQPLEAMREVTLRAKAQVIRTQDLGSSYPYASPATEPGFVAGEVLLSSDRIVASTVLQNIALPHGCLWDLFNTTTVAMKAHESLFCWSQWALPVYDAAHDAFMTLPPHTTSSREDDVRPVVEGARTGRKYR